MKSKTLGIITILLAATLLAVSCASGPVVIPDDATAPELIQRAQEASDRNRYNIALQYYEAVLERYPLYSDYVCAAEYEIGFIYYKQKKYIQSKIALNSLLERYISIDGELLPPQYRVLAQKILVTIEEIESSSTKR